MKILLILFTTILLLTSCKSEREEELESEVSLLQARVANLRNKIEECNDNINSAKSSAGDSYDDMEYALNSLDDCSQY